jgi:hypothetical protein
MQPWNYVIALGLVVTSPAFPESEPQWKTASGSFGAVLLVTDNAPRFFGGHEDAPSADALSRIRTTSKVRRGETVVGVVIFYGCAPDDAGNCRSSMQLRLRHPDGSVYGGYEPELWNGAAPPAGTWQTSVGNLGFFVEPDDPLGTYTFEAVLRDHVSGRTLKLSQTVEVVADAP